jgi:hypothetical protein
MPPILSPEKVVRHAIQGHAPYAPPRHVAPFLGGIQGIVFKSTQFFRRESLDFQLLAWMITALDRCVKIRRMNVEVVGLLATPVMDSLLAVCRT